MPCRICIQLEQAAAAAVRSDPPNILLGLNEAGIRNRARQKEDREADRDVETADDRRRAELEDGSGEAPAALLLRPLVDFLGLRRRH